MTMHLRILSHLKISKCIYNYFMQTKSWYSIFTLRYSSLERKEKPSFSDRLPSFLYNTVIHNVSLGYQVFRQIATSYWLHEICERWKQATNMNISLQGGSYFMV